MIMRKTLPLILFFCLSGFSPFLRSQVSTFEEISAESGISDIANITDLYGNGAALADFDNDGDIDFYLTTDKNISDRLYENNGMGYFTDIAVESGIVETNSNRAALWFDFNGDHRLDLVVASENCVNLSCENPVSLALYKQLEDGSFIEVSEEAGLTIGSEFDYLPVYAIGGFAAADLNQDDYLDLIFTVWGGGIKFFQNNGNETFSDLTDGAGFFLESKTPWQPMLYDFNEDGLIDIYCNIDYASNKLWINKGGTFEDQAAEYGLDNAFNEMGMAMNDFDNDGDLDIYITNITRFHQGKRQYNILLEQEKNNGSIRFKETAKSQGVGLSGWDWGTTFIDINNDGKQDLLTTNGWNHALWKPDQSKLWLNTKGGFLDVSEQSGFNDFYHATTLLGFDKDRDGDMDILQTLKDNESIHKPALIYENQFETLPYLGNYMNVKPRMAGANHLAIGSQVTIVAKDLISSRLISAGCSFYGQEPAEAFFGLGSLEKIEEIKVKWPNGKISIYPDLPINQIHTLDYDYVSPPSDLNLVEDGDQTLLTWKDNSDNESGFILYISHDSSFSDAQKIMLNENVITREVLEIDKRLDYFFMIRAFNENVLSGNSNFVKIKATETITASETAFSVYPNPVMDNLLTIRNQIASEGLLYVNLYDISGKELWTGISFQSPAIRESNFNIDLTPGLYIISIRMNDLEERHKLIVK